LPNFQDKLTEAVRQVESLREEKQELVSAMDQLRAEKETAEDNELKSLEAFDEAEQRASKFEQKAQKLENFLVSIDINPETVDDYL
jgi:chromosome segregation ATPase